MTPKTIAEIIAELQAVDTTELTGVVAAVNQAIEDLQALPAAADAADDPIATVVITTQSGVVTTCTPQ